MSPEQAEMVLHALGLAWHAFERRHAFVPRSALGLPNGCSTKRSASGGLVMVQAVRDQWLIVLGIVAVLAALAVIWRSRRH